MPPGPRATIFIQVNQQHGGPDMTYKQMLIQRYHSTRRDETPREPLDYMALRNFDALRAWRRRRLEQADQTPRHPRSAWLSNSRRSVFFVPAIWSNHAT
jgi:hypothetical protein